MRPPIATALAAVALFGPNLLQPAGALELAPHRAIYSMALAAARGGDIVDLSGRMYLEWTDVCDGWTVNQRVRLVFTNREGPTFENDFSFSSWESRDGLEFRYTMRTTTEGRLIEEVDGRAALQGKGEGGVARFVAPEATDLALPPGTVFPTEHLFEIAERAHAGERAFMRRVFSGTGIDSLNEVATFIGNEIAASSRPLGPAGEHPAVVSALAEQRSWPVALAYYPADGRDGVPEFEVQFRLMENGVASSLDLDYGDFAIRGRLDQLQYLKPTC